MTLYEHLLSSIAKNFLIYRFIRTNVFLLRTIPEDLANIISEYAFRPSEILGRRPYYFEIIFSSRAILLL